MTGQRILQGTTQTLLAYPRVEAADFVLGQPSAAEVRISTPAVAFPSEDDAWPSATVDPISVAVTAVGAVGASTLTVASAAWVAGRKYLVTDTDDETAVVVCAKTVTGTTLYLAEPLQKAVSTSATVKGWAVTKALTAAQTEQAGSGVAIWHATIDGVVYSWSEAFRIVRRMVRVPLTAPELTSLFPVVRSLLLPTQTPDELISAAWTLRVLHKLSAKNVREEDVVDSEALRPLLVAACLYHLAVSSRAATPEWREGVLADYERVGESTFARADWHDAPQTADPPRDPDPTNRRIGIRVSR